MLLSRAICLSLFGVIATGSMAQEGVVDSACMATKAQGANCEAVVLLRGTPRVGPKGINARIAQADDPIPRGYKKAWQDGRLNPLRGAGTLSGKRSMGQVWSNTVPRVLLRD